MHFTITFTEPVTGVDVTDLKITASSGITGAAITGISPTDGLSHAVYTVTVSTGTGDGTLRLDVIDDDSIADIAGNPLGGLGVGNGNYVAGPPYTSTRRICPKS